MCIRMCGCTRSPPIWPTRPTTTSSTSTLSTPPTSSVALLAFNLTTPKVCYPLIPLSSLTYFSLSLSPPSLSLTRYYRCSNLRTGLSKLQCSEGHSRLQLLTHANLQFLPSKHQTTRCCYWQYPLLPSSPLLSSPPLLLSPPPLLLSLPILCFWSCEDVVDEFWIIKDNLKPKWNVSEKFLLLPSFENGCD